MKRFNKITMAGAMALVIGVTSITGFATPRSTTTVGITAEKTEDFRNERLAEKKANLENQVKEGRISQEKADTIIKALEENRVNCDGSGGQRIGQKEGARFGANGQAKGQGQNAGRRGQGGMRLRDGTCLNESGK